MNADDVTLGNAILRVAVVLVVNHALLRYHLPRGPFSGSADRANLKEYHLSEPKHPGFNLDTMKGKQSLDISREAREALRVATGWSATEAQAQTLIAQHSALGGAQRYLQENALGTSIAAMEFKRVEEMRRLMNPYEDLRKLLRPVLGLQAAAEVAKQQQNPIAKSSIDAEAFKEFSKHLDDYRIAAKTYEAGFRLPSSLEANRLLSAVALDGASVAAYMRQHTTDIASQRQLVASISQPWLRQIDAARSAIALTELQGLGAALKSIHGFDNTLTTALRVDFGDWRDRVEVPQVVIDSPVERTLFYVERGFNAALTEFPEETFQESLVLFGLNVDEEEAVEWTQPLRAADVIEEAAFQRTNKCHNYLQRLERRLREFIDAAMTSQYGVEWPRKRLTPQMLESWESKKSRAESSGSVLNRFIEVADFTDYEAIICRRDHWREVFENHFKRQESVRESLQRLYPIRLATMHARFVTKEDELYLLAESRRLLGAIER